MLYLIANKELGVCKIGYTKNFKERLITLNTGFPFKIEAVALINGERHHERALHAAFSSLRMKGEWFKWDPCIPKAFTPTHFEEAVNPHLPLEHKIPVVLDMSSEVYPGFSLTGKGFSMEEAAQDLRSQFAKLKAFVLDIEKDPEAFLVDEESVTS